MEIGYACIPLTIKATTNRRLLLKDYNENTLKQLIGENLSDLKLILKENKKHNIKFFRIGSNIIPLASHKVNTFNWEEHFSSTLLDIGEYIKSNNIRVSMHAGHFTVLNSNDKDVVKNSINDLNYHCNFLNSLNIDYSHKIILHIGGLYGDKILAKKRFVENFKYLRQDLKNRIVIENDEKSFSLDDVLELSNILNIPVVYDNLHNTCFGDNNYSHKEIYSMVCKTWKTIDGNMKVHYSQQDLGKKLGSHSKTIFIDDFLKYYNEIKDFTPDIMLEVKDKDISAIKCINSLKELSRVPLDNEILSEFKKYELLLLERNPYFDTCKFIKEKSIIKLYKNIDEILKTHVNYEGFKMALSICLKELSPYINNRELSHFNNLLYKKENLQGAKIYIGKLSNKYNLQSIINSYYLSQ
ncbi:MAG: UV DNA damage repair endonuclease UvsE [Clostridium perfringens]|nr:UV DNA damage repair endonuclease UvsE [Clostridium perfringens]